MLSLLPCLLVQARVGERISQSEMRYGTGQEVEEQDNMILKNARNLVYHHGDWIITAAFLNDVTVRLRYERLGTQSPRVKLEREDVAEILEAEDPGGWHFFNEKKQKEGKAYTAGQYPPPVMQSARGLTARYQVFQVTVECDAAQRHERGLAPFNTQQRLQTKRRGKRVAL